MNNYSINLFDDDGHFVGDLGHAMDYPIKHFNCRCISEPISDGAITKAVKEQEERTDQLMKEFERAYYGGNHTNEH